MLFRHFLAVTLLALTTATGHSAGEYDAAIDTPMYQTPVLPVPSITWDYPRSALGLWLKALESPEVEMRCKAAEAVALASRRGLADLNQAIPRLTALLESSNTPAAARLSAVEALVALNAQSAAPLLLTQARSGNLDVRHLVDPALARWKYAPAGEFWRERLQDPQALPGSLMGTLRALAKSESAEAGDAVRALVFASRQPVAVRLEAAKTLGSLRRQGNESDADRLMGDKNRAGIPHRLFAAWLLRHHRSPEALDRLVSWARDPEPAVAVVALEALSDVDTKRVIPLLMSLVANPDPTVRSLATGVLIREPSPAHLRLLGDRLDDLHLDVRRQARLGLSNLAKRDELRPLVLAEGTRLLNGAGWRGQEQAAVLLTLLGHKPAAPRYLELLNSPREEVLVTAAWSLRCLSLPETLAPALKFAQSRTKDPAGIARDPLSHQMSQLFQLLGSHKYAAAESLWRSYIPMGKGEESRAAAIWALGLLHEDKPMDVALADALEERLNAIQAVPAEDHRVARMSAIGLGRMKAKESLGSLRRHAPDNKPSLSQVNNACCWAVERLTGEKVPAPEPITRVYRDWFLGPID